MSDSSLQYDGERLIPGDGALKNLLLEDLAKFHFASDYGVGKLVLDAGCGAGQGSNHLASGGALRVVAVDVSSEAAEFAAHFWQSENLAFGCMNVEFLGFPSDMFDVVTSIEVIEHLDRPAAYVAEIRRVLKEEGVLVLSTPNKHISSPTPGSMWPHHIHEFYPDELRDLLLRYFSSVDLWGMAIPEIDRHPMRKLVHLLAPVFKPILPSRIRTRFLPVLQNRIKSDLTLDDFQFSQVDVEKRSTLLAVCRC